MTTESLTPQELTYLIVASDHVNSPINVNHLFPDSVYFENVLGIKKQGVSNLKRSLLDKNWLEISIGGEVRLCQKAEEYLDERRRQGDLQIAYVPVPGEVSAGTLVGGELVVRAQEIGDDPYESIPIPPAEPDSRIVAYRVVGDSMEYEHIYEDDYVLVELNPNSAYQKNRMIVTRYLLIGETTDSHHPRGPTLKVYKGEFIDSKNQKYHLLGWKKPYGRHNPKEIRAGSLFPIGVVIGAYRRIDY